MTFAYYTCFFNEPSDKTSLYCTWLYYFLKSGNLHADDVLYVITNEKTAEQVKSSNYYKFLLQLFPSTGLIRYINIEKPENPTHETFVKYFPPIVDILSSEKPDYIFYSDIVNLISGNIRAKFENKEEIPSAYVIFEKNITSEEDIYSYIKTTDWYNENKETVDKFPVINSSLFCIKNGQNETTLLKSIFGNVASEYIGDAFLNYIFYSNSQYINEKCYIELHPELFFNSVEINKLDSKKEIIVLRDIDNELINETLMLSLLCKLEKL